MHTIAEHNYNIVLYIPMLSWDQQSFPPIPHKRPLINVYGSLFHTQNAYHTWYDMLLLQDKNTHINNSSLSSLLSDSLYIKCLWTVQNMDIFIFRHFPILWFYPRNLWYIVKHTMTEQHSWSLRKKFAR